MKRDIGCGSARVGRLMDEGGLRPELGQRFCPQTTDSAHGLPVAPNLLREHGALTAPNQVWSSDITYLWTRQGWVYLATVMDLFSRTIAGWHIEPTIEARLVLTAISKAIAARRPARGLLFHSDQGSQYASTSVRNLLVQHGIRQSMSRRGNCYDNAAQESFFGRFKRECYHRHDVAGLHEARLITFDHIEGFYNTRRLHSSLQFRSPHQFEQAYWSAGNN
jgi:putative transposase